MSRRSTALCTCIGIADVAPKSIVAADSPTARMIAVPVNSARYAFGCQPSHGSRWVGAAAIGEVMLMGSGSPRGRRTRSDSVRLQQPQPRLAHGGERGHGAPQLV